MAEASTQAHWTIAQEHEQIQISRRELVTRIEQAMPEDGVADPLDGVRLRRDSATTELEHGVTFPSFCVIAQGVKEVLLGDKRYWYDSAHYLIATTALPIASRITDAWPDRPYLNMIITLDAALISSVMIETGYVMSRSQPAVAAMDVSDLGADLLDPVVRIARLLHAPRDVAFFLPLLKREIVYHLLRGPQRDRVAQLAALGTPNNRITEALELLRRDFNQPLRIDDIARELGMNISGFHHHFKVLTAMSPLQFQKHLRLQEARRLMLGEGMDAASAGHHVGYDDAAYFNREYKKLFGEPPLRNIKRLREDTQAIRRGAL